VVAGADGLDARQREVKTAPYTAAMKKGVAGMRIGVVKEGFGTPDSESSVDEKVRRAADKFKTLGAHVEDVSVDVHAIGRIIWTPTIVEGAMDLMMRGNGSGTNHGGLFVPGAAATMARWRQNAEEISVPLKVLMLAAEHLSRTYAGSFYGKSQNLIRKMRESYDQALARFDLLLMPTTPQVATKLPAAHASEEEIFSVSLNMSVNTAPFCGTGHPAISVPCGRVGDLPVGLMLIGRHWEEANIYRAAFAFEQSFEWKTA
jgi:amidase